MLLLELFQVAIDRVNGAQAVRLALAGENCPAPLHLLAVGKAAAAMTVGALECCNPQIQDGLVITKHGHLDDLQDERLRLMESDHPVPGAASLVAGQALVEYCQTLPPNEKLLVLISGGASSLVEVLPSGFTLQDLDKLTRILLGSGLDITAINRIRSEVSQIKGGKLLRYLGGREIEVLLISDVPGDDPAMIGSGLFHPSTDNGVVAWPEAVQPFRHKLPVENNTLAGESILPPHRIIANLASAMTAAADMAKEKGKVVYPHDTFLEGDVAAVARYLSDYLRTAPKGIHIWGGETAVTLPPEPGRGGRNQHLGLSMARLLQGNPSVCVLTVGTDGTDGPTGDAGALIDGGTIERGELAGLDVEAALMSFDSGRFLEASGDLVTTGPTGTNVMDLVIASVDPV
jgi:hydroxypyruvate reductase